MRGPSKTVEAKKSSPVKKGAVAEKQLLPGADAVPVERRRSDDRREGDRRKQSVPVAVERRQSERRKTPRRRQIDPTTCERDYSHDEIEFMQALDDYKRRSGRMFPTCSEILEVIRAIGYVREVAPGAAENPSESNQA